MKLLSGNKIVALDKQVNKDPSLIPKLPFSMQITGSKGAGKSSTLLNMLLNKDLLAGKFNRIYWISPTSSLDSKLDVLKESTGIVLPNKPLIQKLKEKNRYKIIDDNINGNTDYHTCFTDENFVECVSIEFLTDIMNEQKHIIKAFGKSIADNILLVFDDTASESKFWKSQTVQRMVFNSRHLKISIIYSVQNYTSLPKPLRLNNSILILFETANKKELELIYNENVSKYTFQDFYKLFQTVVSIPFHFLVFNYQNPVKYRFQDCFEKFIFDT